MLKKNKKREIFRTAIVLGVFGFLASSYVSIIHIITKSKIQHQEAIYKNKIFNQIVPSNFYDNDINKSCFIFNNKLLGDDKNHYLWIAKKNNKMTVIIFDIIAPDGYSGSIKMMISLDIIRGKILGVRVLNHNETPGLGDKIDINISDWITKFSGVSISYKNDLYLSLKKFGGNIDQFTGATITPLSIVNSIKRIVKLMRTFPLSEILNLSPCNVYE
ncbi:MAG: electron transport complex subunit RsxG [Buchnera aphidicola (Chaetogeoica yunlongensis)]